MSPRFDPADVRRAKPRPTQCECGVCEDCPNEPVGGTDLCSPCTHLCVP